MHYLFVCYANAQRSPTAKDVCRKIAKANDFDIEAGSVGISKASNKPLTQEMVNKADKIFVMEEDMMAELVQYYQQNPGKIVSWDIPDVYNRDDPILVHILEGKLYEFLAEEGLL